MTRAQVGPENKRKNNQGEKRKLDHRRGFNVRKKEEKKGIRERTINQEEKC